MTLSNKKPANWLEALKMADDIETIAVMALGKILELVGSEYAGQKMIEARESEHDDPERAITRSWAERWSWRATNSRASFYDEFPSREAAIEDAKDNGMDVVYVGRVEDLRPEDYINFSGTDVFWLLDFMDEAAEVDTDDRVFTTNEDGQRALHDILRNWAREYVSSNIHAVMRDEEKVTL
jgi:hypothetical protein